MHHWIERVVEEKYTSSSFWTKASSAVTLVQVEAFTLPIRESTRWAAWYGARYIFLSSATISWVSAWPVFLLSERAGSGSLCCLEVEERCAVWYVRIGSGGRAGICLMYGNTYRNVVSGLRASC